MATLPPPTTSSVLLGISVPPYAIEYGNRLASKPVGASMIGASGAREGAAGHATIPEGGRVINCFGATTNRDTNEITWTN